MVLPMIAVITRSVYCALRLRIGVGLPLSLASLHGLQISLFGLVMLM